MYHQFDPTGMLVRERQIALLEEAEERRLARRLRAVRSSGQEKVMRRIMMLLTVVALMMVMMAMSVAPAFAHAVDCTGNGIRTGTTPGFNGDKDGDGVSCYNPNSGKYQDDHGANGH